MKFMFMDESGKEIMKQPNQNVFIFGGLIVDKSNVYNSLQKFKVIYKNNRDNLKKTLGKNITGADRAKRMQELLEHFEFHAVQMFNPQKDIIKGKKLIRENPWKYSESAELFKAIHEIFIEIIPYIDKIYMFKVDKDKFISYCTDNSIMPTDKFIYDRMIEFIIDEYALWLAKEDRKGAIIPDRLDSSIRDSFVSEIEKQSHDRIWSEPIIVESYSNAFIQLIDIITYCYYMVYCQTKNKRNFNAIERVFNIHIKDKLDVKDLIDYLNKDKKEEKEKEVEKQKEEEKDKE